MTNTDRATERPYYAKNGLVWKRPVYTEQEDGSTSISMGFPVCKLHEACAGQEKAFAKMLNEAEVALPVALKALEELLDVVQMADWTNPDLPSWEFEALLNEAHTNARKAISTIKDSANG